MAHGVGTADPRGSSKVARAKARVEDVTSKASATASAARKKSQYVDTAFLAYERDRRSVGNVLAGAVAFRLFVYLLPLALAIVTLLGIIAGTGVGQPSHLAQNSGLGRSVVNTIATATSESKKSLWVLVPLSLYGVYSGGTAVVKVLRAVHAAAWGQPLTKMKRGMAAAFALFGVAVVLLSVLVALNWVRERSAGLGLTSTLLSTAVFAGGWFLASRALPHGDAPWWALLPGALLVGVGCQVLHLLSVYYLTRKISSASELYGSLGAAAAIIAWLYLVGRLFVGSAMLNASFWERWRPDRVPADEADR